LLCSR
jgi:Predicted signal transduction protein with a C-terminal ATPase domain